MTLTEEFAKIVENEQEVLPFLKALDKAQKKELYPGLKKLQKYYSEYAQQGTSSTYSSRGSSAQTQILSMAAFICFNQKDFEQSISYGIINREKLTPILPWYCPDWFNAYLDKLSLQEYVGNYFDYDWYLELAEQGYVQINLQMVAKILPELIFTRNKTYRFTYHPEALLKRPVTLQEHIWYLFEYETNVYAAENYKQFEDNSKPGRWMQVLKQYMDEGKIERESLLKASIACTTKNFNQSASNWFMDLFMFLEPTTAELLQLQNELLNTFNSASSKPYNVVLKLFKDLALEPEFDIPDFLDHVPLVLTSESKTAVASALMVFDKLAKKYPEYRETICNITCQAFIHPDHNLQLRAAKLLQKYGETGSEELKQTLQSYHEALFSEARDLLSAFLEDFSNAEALMGSMPTETSQKLTEIRMPETFDEFVFLASQAFDQNETYHFDLLPAALLKFQDQMTADYILKLMPAFQRAYKMITSDWTSNMGYLDNMLCKFWISYGQLLVSNDRRAAEPIRAMHQSFVKSEDERKAKWGGYQIRLSGGIKAWDIYTHSIGYKPHKHILLNAFFMLERDIKLPLLSTPTHEPCWVSPIVLIDRLSQYQKAKVMPGDMDMQISIARCLPGDAETIRSADAKLQGEYRELVGLILGEERFPKDSYQLKPAWLVAGMTKAPTHLNKWSALTTLPDVYLTGEFEWESLVEDFVWKKYDYNLKKEVPINDQRKIIRIHFGGRLKKISVLKSVFSKLLPAQKEPERSIYDLTELKYEYISGEHNDIRRLLYLNPDQPQILLAQIIHKGLRFIDFSGENDKKLITYTLETLLSLPIQPGKIYTLFIASCMISSDKTIRTYAAELWIKGVTEQSLDSAALGKIIGRHEYIELAPLKRFTDLVISNMFQISKQHNRALESLLENSIALMNDTPITGCKKLLEIYAEILSTNKSKISNEQVLKRLNAWGKTETLKKIIQKFPTGSASSFH